MFTKAGFSHRIHAICSARVSRYGRSGCAIGYLVRWPDSGDVAWASHTQIVWPEHVCIESYFHVPGASMGCPVA